MLPEIAEMISLVTSNSADFGHHVRTDHRLTGCCQLTPKEQ
jgi:hypothetical protein